MKTLYKIIFATFLLLGFNACEKEDEHNHNNNEIAGCTDEEASNYDPNANEDDGSCEYEGCTDEEASNYDPNANEDDGSCEYEGCTDENACNYDSTAEIENNKSCIYPNECGSCVGDLTCYGCTNPDALNYNPESTVDDGSCIILGCTDPNASNYNQEATNDDGSCEYSVSALLNGCWSITLLNYDTDVDLSFLESIIGFNLGTQQITGQAQDAGYLCFNYKGMTYSNELDFDTEPFPILTFEAPSIPFNSTSSGSWILENNDTDIILTDQNTGNQDYYEIVSITNNSLFLNGTVSQSVPIPGFEGDDSNFEIDVQMQLEKNN